MAKNKVKHHFTDITFPTISHVQPYNLLKSNSLQLLNENVTDQINEAFISYCNDKQWEQGQTFTFF